MWFSNNSGIFAFASEKKVLEKLGFIDIQELNPRQILIYNILTKELEIKQRTFFTFEPEHSEDYELIKEKTKQLLDESIKKRITNKKFGLLLALLPGHG